MSDSFYVIQGTTSAGVERVSSLPTTGSPWGPTSQHGSPPAALMASALEGLEGAADRAVGRITVELLGPVPVGPLTVGAAMVRPGRNVDLCEATLHDEEPGRPVARAAAWRFPAGVDGPRPGSVSLPHGRGDGEEHTSPSAWSTGYLDAVEWRWIKGAVAELDPAVWGFQNTELTVHLLREPVGTWFCLDAETDLGSGSIGLATSAVYDEQGLVARTAQALLTRPRHPS